MPASAVHTFSNQELLPAVPQEQYPAFEINVALAQGTYQAGQLLGELSATPGRFGAYVDANVDGTGVAKVILERAATVDASGNITQQGEFGATRKHAAVYVAGCFRESDLVGLDANAVADLQARQVNGLLIF